VSSSKALARSAFTHAKRIASKDMGLKQKDVAEQMKLVPPNARTFSSSVEASTKRIPLIKFSARGPEPSRGKGRGVTYRVGRGRQRHSSAFITKVGGHRGVFERKGRRRLPIQEHFGPSVGRVVAENDREIAAKGEADFVKEFDRLIDRIIDGRIGGRVG